MNDDRVNGGEHVKWWHLIAHGIAFFAATAIAAIVFHPYYPKFGDQTESASEAFWAFLTFCIIFGGIGPLITLLFFALQRLFGKHRSAVSVSPRREAP
ncbi:MAG: hypothetical protein WA709_08840 [Stellaceae bacterium]